MRIRAAALLVLVAAMLAAAPAAYAGKTKTYAPPGKAGTSEYSEVVPTAGGNVAAPPNGGSGATAAQISHLGAAKAGVRKITKLGKQGAAAAQLAEATAPVATPGTGETRGPGASGHLRPTRTGAFGGSAVSGFRNVLLGSDAGGIGIFLPLLLAFGLGAAVGVSVLRVWRARRPTV